MENPLAKKIFSEKFRNEGVPTPEDIELAKEKNALSDLNKATQIETEKQKNYRQEYLRLKRKRDQREQKKKNNPGFTN